MKTDTTNLIAAMCELARTAQSRDGVAKEEIFEALHDAAERLGLQQGEITLLTMRNSAYSTLTESLESQLSHLRAKDDERRSAVATLDSERAANARMTAEIERLTAERDAAIAADVEHDDMAAVGRALMHAIAAHAPKGWAPADCPSEIVGDLRNAIDESYSNGVRAGLGMAASELDDWACEMDSVSPEAASELREHAESLRGKP